MEVLGCRWLPQLELELLPLTALLLLQGDVTSHFLPTGLFEEAFGFNGRDVFTTITMQSSISLLLKQSSLLACDLELTESPFSGSPTTSRP